MKNERNENVGKPHLTRQQQQAQNNKEIQIANKRIGKRLRRRDFHRYRVSKKTTQNHVDVTGNHRPHSNTLSNSHPFHNENV